MKKITSLLFSLFLYSNILCSQNNNASTPLTRIDSLKNELTKVKEDTSALNLLNTLTTDLINVSDYENSRKYASQAIVLADKLLSEIPVQSNIDYMNKCKKIKARFIHVIGLCYKNEANYTEALKHYLVALKIREEIADKPGIASSYNNIGNINIDQGHYIEALKNHLDALKIRKEINDKPGIASSYNNIGNINYAQGDYTAALNNFSASLKIREETGDQRGIAACVGNIGNVYKEQANYTEALKNNLMSLKLYEKTSDKLGVSRTFNNIGEINWIKGNYSEALKNHFASLRISKEIGNKTGIAFSYNNIGLIYQFQGNETEALKNYVASLKIKEEIGDKKGIAFTYSNIGMTYKSQGNEKEILKNYLAALKIFEEIGDKKGIALTYSNIGRLKMHEGNTGEALKNYLISLKVREEIGDKKGIGTCYSNLGDFYNQQDNYKEALKHHLFGLKIQEEIGNKPDAIKSYNRVGNIYQNQKNYLEALKNYRVSFDSTKSFLSENFNSLTEKDKSAFKNEVIGYSDNYFTNAYSITSRFDDSLQWLYNYQLFQRGIVLESSSGLAASVQQDTSLHELWAKFAGYKNIVGKEYLKPIDDRRKDLSALEDSTNNSERELLEKSTPYRKWKERVNVNWQDIQKHLDKNEAAIEFISFNLRRKKEETDRILYAAMVLTSQMKYPKFLFLFKEKQLVGLLKNITTANTSGISNLYTAMRGAIVGNSSAGVLQSGDSLYKLIWRPLTSYLKDVKSISFVPDGLLNKISMAAIPNPDGTLLCSKYQLRQMASTRTIAFPSGEPQSHPAAFFGGIDYTYTIPMDTTITLDSNSLSLLEVVNRSRGTEFDFLEGTKKETAGLSSLYNAKKYPYHLIEGKNATEKTFKQQEGKSPAVIHIATHGFFFPSPEKNERHHSSGESTYSLAVDPLLRSGLILSGGNYAWKNGTNPYEDEDGILTAYEISHLNLSTTDLIVLSACETGLGDIKGSEGVYGLQRAFKTAGVKYIVMSLWQVPDKETQEFMQTFYSKWLSGNPIRSAFRDTQLEMSSIHEPYKWAAFVLVE